jgi:hypothetical protein
LLEDVAPSAALCDTMSHEELGTQQKIGSKKLGAKNTFLGTKTHTIVFLGTVFGGSITEIVGQKYKLGRGELLCLS